jgi:glycerol-3-phosphate dehydrogenase
MEGRNSDPMTRRASPRVLIIGAGINGCGVFRDLCLQKIDCLLVDRGDICEGASAASSRLIHGGIKYLETGEFRLVRESCMERNRLLRNAPHYVKPLETLLPVRSWFGGMMASALRFAGLPVKLADRGIVITDLGLRLYDLYSRSIKALPDHSFFGQKQLAKEMPDLDRKILAAGVYYEGRVTHGERLGLELVLDGLVAHPESAVETYTEVSRSASGRLQVTDRLTNITRDIEVDYIVNAGGAWIDDINRALGIENHYMGGTKGSHLVVHHPALRDALKDRMIYFGTADGRVNLVYPFFNHVLIGSTDIKINHPDDAQCSDEEIDYLLACVKEIFPSFRLTRDDIILTYCGVRPLPKSDGRDAGSISRDHHLVTDHLPGTDIPVLSLIGGKWTTFRAFSEEAATIILDHFGRSRLVSTEDTPIGGGRNYPVAKADRSRWVDQTARRYASSPERIEELLERYGTGAVAIAETEAALGKQPLRTIPDYSRAEILFLARHEKVRRLVDILLRRTEMVMSGRITKAVIEEIAEIVSTEWSWSEAVKSAEIDHATQAMKLRRIRLDS